MFGGSTPWQNRSCGTLFDQDADPMSFSSAQSSSASFKQNRRIEAPYVMKIVLLAVHVRKHKHGFAARSIKPLTFRALLWHDQERKCVPL
jgi:hypothetical protein